MPVRPASFGLVTVSVSVDVPPAGIAGGLNAFVKVRPVTTATSAVMVTEAVPVSWAVPATEFVLSPGVTPLIATGPRSHDAPGFRDEKKPPLVNVILFVLVFVE